jgi:hypothetical protein
MKRLPQVLPSTCALPFDGDHFSEACISGEPFDHFINAQLIFYYVWICYFRRLAGICRGTPDAHAAGSRRRLRAALSQVGRSVRRWSEGAQPAPSPVRNDKRELPCNTTDRVVSNPHACAWQARF